jgi:hypothetical protein
MIQAGTIYDQSAEIRRILYRINSVGVYDHKVIGNSYTIQSLFPHESRKNLIFGDVCPWRLLRPSSPGRHFFLKMAPPTIIGAPIVLPVLQESTIIKAGKEGKSGKI